MYVNYTGQTVTAGEKLMDIYSPELVAAEQELLTALSYDKSVRKSELNNIRAGGNELLQNALKKLELLEIPESEIERLKQTGQVKTYITLYAQKKGTVLEKNIIEGQKIMNGNSLFHIADLSHLWLTADVYEYELEKVSLNSPAKIRFSYFPGKVYEGKISFIYPVIDPKSKTAKIRIEINNEEGKLKPAMFASVTIEGTPLGFYPAVPENTVIRSGLKNIVIISLGNGRLRPQEITLGVYSDGYYQVLKGLKEGTSVVTSGEFLIDSESNLNAALKQFLPAEKKSGPVTGSMEK